ncbi:MAG: hypothetical protein QOF78_3914 [Phycisphaerales bacterium]|jgi:hypothetical protein|nr:hypothetical protein [Phycisphaerales bacterium]
MWRVLFASIVIIATAGVAGAEAWSDDPIWHDGLVEKAVYTASRVVYDKPRAYEAIFFTNKEQHERNTLSKADKSADTIEVWKHNQVEVIPTPNYDYKYVTTSHLVVNGLTLTRLDCSSQEFCGTSFKQYQLTPDFKRHDYWSFSYMPETGRRSGVVDDGPIKVVAQDSLPLWLRGFPFGGRVEGLSIRLLPSQKSNRPTPYEAVNARVKYAGEEGDAYKLELLIEDKLAGTYWMAKDPERLHVMLKYRGAGADGQQYDLKSVERVNYWTVAGR